MTVPTASRPILVLALLTSKSSRSWLKSTMSTPCGGGWITALRWFHHWATSGWVCLSRRIRVISRVNAAGSSTSSFASASGLSRTMAMSISPLSLWIIVGRPAYISARIATALFSHKVRSHFSRALCARVSVCGEAFRAPGVPNARRKELSGGMGNGKR